MSAYRLSYPEHIFFVDILIQLAIRSMVPKIMFRHAIILCIEYWIINIFTWLLYCVCYLTSSAFQRNILLADYCLFTLVSGVRSLPFYLHIILS